MHWADVRSISASERRLFCLIRGTAVKTGRCVAVLVLIVATVVMSGDPPDSKLNPGTGYIETVDSVWGGSRYDVRHTLDKEGQPSESGWVSTNTDDDLGPRIEIDSADDTWVVWWRDKTTDEVWFRSRDVSTGDWGNERRASSSTESSRNPEIVHDGTDTWVVFEFDDSGDTGIGVLAIVDEPAPMGSRKKLATAIYTGSVDARIHYESSHLWVSWVDDSDDVGWSEWDYTSESWSSTDYEDYSADSVSDARGRIRTDILGI